VAKRDAGRSYRLINIQIPGKDEAVNEQTFSFRINRDKLRKARRHEGHYLLRSNITGESPEKLWQFYFQLTEVERAFKELKSDLAIRPIYHQKDDRIEAHIFVAFVAYCLQATLKQRLRTLAPGLTPRAVLEKIRRHPDGGRASANHRRATSDALASYRTGCRSEITTAANQDDPSPTTTAENHRHHT
jgi:hypothetical protein